MRLILLTQYRHMPRGHIIEDAAGELARHLIGTGIAEILPEKLMNGGAPFASPVDRMLRRDKLQLKAR